MKWSLYKIMSKEDKEEYNYRFAKNKTGPATEIFNTGGFKFFSFIILFILGVLILLSNIKLMQSNNVDSEVIKTITKGTLKIINATVSVMIVFLIAGIGCSFYDMFIAIKEKRWLKDKGYVLQPTKLKIKKKE